MSSEPRPVCQSYLESLREALQLCPQQVLGCCGELGYAPACCRIPPESHTGASHTGCVLEA